VSSSGLPLGLAQQPTTFVIAKRLDVYAGLGRSFANPHEPILNPILSYRVKGLRDHHAWTRIPSMTTFERLAPVFPVRDVRAALEHYRRLGFVAEAYGEQSEGELIYGFIRRGAVELHLTRTADLDPKRNTSACYLYVDDANSLFEEWSRVGAGGQLHPPTDTPYCLREFTHIDLDGNLLRVGSPIQS
jgi:hypothetical protein